MERAEEKPLKNGFGERQKNKKYKLNGMSGVTYKSRCQCETKKSKKITGRRE